MVLYIKKQSTQHQDANAKINKLFRTDLCTCETEDESCNNLMLDDQSIDEDSVTDDM